MKKSLKNLARVAAGLGAAYALTKMGKAKAETSREDASVDQYIGAKQSDVKTSKKEKVGVEKVARAATTAVNPFESGRVTTAVNPLQKAGTPFDNKTPFDSKPQGVPGLRIGEDFIIASKFDKFTPNKKFTGPNFRQDYAARSGIVSKVDKPQAIRRAQLADFDKKVAAKNTENFKSGGMSVIAKSKLTRNKPTKIC